MVNDTSTNDSMDNSFASIPSDWERQEVTVRTGDEGCATETKIYRAVGKRVNVLDCSVERISMSIDIPFEELRRRNILKNRRQYDEMSG